MFSKINKLTDMGDSGGGITPPKKVLIIAKSDFDKSLESAIIRRFEADEVEYLPSELQTRWDNANADTYKQISTDICAHIADFDNDYEGCYLDGYFLGVAWIFFSAAVFRGEYDFVFSENGKLVDYPMIFWREIRKRDIDSATEAGKDFVYNLGM